MERRRKRKNIMDDYFLKSFSGLKGINLDTPSSNNKYLIQANMNRAIYLLFWTKTFTEINNLLTTVRTISEELRKVTLQCKVNPNKLISEVNVSIETIPFHHLKEF